jgi:hypothetical protein
MKKSTLKKVLIATVGMITLTAVFGSQIVKADIVTPTKPPPKVR